MFFITLSLASSSLALAAMTALKPHHFVATAPILQPKGIYVGQLQEKWRFPSDHLPIAMTFDGLGVVSWNVLDAKFMEWVTEKDSQGLGRSMIADEHVAIDGSNLTVRERHVADLILEMRGASRSILCLQECSEAFLQELASRLPSHSKIFSSHGEAVVVDLLRFEVLSHHCVAKIFSDAPYRSIQELSLRSLDNGQLLRLVNVHLPGDPTKPGRYEFGNYLASTFDPAVALIATGDMNFNELEMKDAMDQAFANQSPLSIHSPYCTNISPYVYLSKAIDHFLVYSPKQAPIELSAPEELLHGLSEIVDLLEKVRLW